MGKKRSGNEVQLARGRLQAALVAAVSSDESDNENDEKKSDTEIHPILPTKGRPPKKLKETEENNVILVKEKRFESYVMKLFDRSVDLAKYKESSPLYPICRAWIQNSPKMQYAIKTESHTNPRNQFSSDFLRDVEEKKINDITELPIPKSSELTRTLPKEKEEKDYKNIIDLDYNLDHPPFTKEELLSDHKKNWQTLKNDWIQHSRRYNKEKYSFNFDILDVVLKSSETSK